jgi:urease accessory protein UreH
VVAPVQSSPTQQGRATLEVGLVAGESAVTSAFASSPLKLLTPRSRGQSVWACTSSFGGGLVAGDETRLDLQLRTNARCFLGTQASTKVYRNPALLPCGHTTRAMLETNSLLVFAPDPVQAFADSRYTQRQEFHLATGAGLALVDWFTSGRAACGERWEFAHFQSRNEVWHTHEPLTPALSPREWENRSPAHAEFVTDFGSTTLLTSESVQPLFPLPGGEGQGEGERKTIQQSVQKILFLDALRLDSRTGTLTSPHVTGRFNCFALLLFIGLPLREFAAKLLEEIAPRPVERQSTLVCSASPIRDGALLRVAGESVEQVGRELHHHLKSLAALLGDDPWARKW